VALKFKVRTSREPHSVVCTFDDDVSQSDEADRGWIPLDRASVTNDATVLDVRPLNVTERAECRDEGGWRRRHLAMARKGTVAVNGEEKRWKLSRFFEGLSDDSLLLLLGYYVAAISAAEDPQKIQRIACDGGEVDEDEDDEAEGE